MRQVGLRRVKPRGAAFMTDTGHAVPAAPLPAQRRLAKQWDGGGTFALPVRVLGNAMTGSGMAGVVVGGRESLVKPALAWTRIVAGAPWLSRLGAVWVVAA